MVLAASHGEDHRIGQQCHGPDGRSQALESIPGMVLGGGEAVMLCHPALQGPLGAHQLENSVSASQTLGTPNLYCFRQVTKSITTAPLKYKDCHCNMF